MAVMTTGRFTRADLDAMPDDGRRYELLGGAIVVTPAPGWRHQRAVTALWKLLEDNAPTGLQAAVAPFDTVLGSDDIVQPDVLVVDLLTIQDDKLAGLPLLAVEVTSPSSRRTDVGDKLTAYRDAGVPSYWVVDPVEPRLRAWRLENREYVEIADVRGDEEWTAEHPFPVTVRPVDLTR
jgi:Uma2 family endonuclease